MAKAAQPARAMKAGAVRKPKSVSAARAPLTKKNRLKHERGNGLKFALETYEAVSCFTPQTKIKYGPNPKNQGSKSYDRYNKYMKATTIEQALKLGSKPADLLWEYERGFFKVIGGPKADAPNCTKGKLREKSGAERVLSAFRGPSGFSLKMSPEKRNLCAKLAAEFGYDLDKLHAEADTTGNNESADVQTQRTLANALAERRLSDAKKAGRKVSDADATAVLQVWGFAQNETRLNVLPEGQTWVHSDTLGAMRLRTGGFRITDPTLSYPHFTTLLCRWFADQRPDDIECPCVFTGINVNANYAGRVHRDGNNEGPSAIKAVGKFSGGKLRYWPKDLRKKGPRPDVKTLKPKDSMVLDLSKKFVLFDGNRAHGVEKFKGDRFSLVFFTSRNYGKVKDEDRKRLTKVGFNLPTDKLVKDMKTQVSAMYD